MKNFVLLLCAFVMSSTLSGQSIPLYSDNFDTYPIGMGIAFSNPTWWTTWNNMPGTQEDGIIDPVYYSSGTQSFQVYDQPVPTDLLLKLGNRTNGRYDLNWKLYFEPGCGGHINLQHFETPGVEWACEIWFEADGSGFLRTGGVNYPFMFPHGNWFLVENYIDLDNNFIRLVIAGNIVHEWPFSYQTNSTSGTNQLGAVDFYSGTYTAATPKYFVDDVNFMEYQDIPSYFENFESYASGENIAMENPTWWKTWENLPGTSQDGAIITGNAHSGTHTVSIDFVPDNTDLVLKLGDRKTGQYKLSWWMYIQPSYGGYYNIQHYESVGLDYACEVWFNSAGSGFLRAGGNDYPFVYPQYTWFRVVHYIDLDNDLIMLVINGEMVHHWPFSYQSNSTGGTKQLGGVDFYAATPDGSPPYYLVDDVELIPRAPAEIPLSPWALALGITLIVLISLIRFRKSSVALF